MEEARKKAAMIRQEDKRHGIGKRSNGDDYEENHFRVGDKI
jgi:hypothetical protein